jgi:hypothetical protein
MLPGAYLIKMVPSSGRSSFAPLIVRGGTGKTVFPLGTMTYQAYNRWGGRNAYYAIDPVTGVKSGENRLRIVSFQRPYVFVDALLTHDRPIDWWLEKNGIDTVYTTDVFLSSHTEILAHSSLLVIGMHFEYATTRLFDAVRLAVKAGLNVINNGANAFYWRAAPLPDNRVLMSKEDNSAWMPITKKFRDFPAAQPEAGLLGGMYDCFGMSPQSTKTIGASFPFKQAGVAPGTALTGLGFGETDQYSAVSSPSATQILARTSFKCEKHQNVPTNWDMTYTAPRGQGGVFSAGTFGWACSLGPACAKVDSKTISVVDQAMSVLVAAAEKGPLGKSYPSIPFKQGRAALNR